MKSLLLSLILLITIVACKPSTPENTQPQSISVAQRMGTAVDPGFARALAPRPFNFPQDHGPHPGFATEWWYFTGNLMAENDSRFGYQLTLFRIGLKPGVAVADSSWRSHQLYMGHLAISDISQQQHLSAERLSRAAAGLAGAQSEPLRVWLSDWSIHSEGKELFPIRLNAETPEIAIDLTLAGESDSMVLQGDAGLSQKGAETGNASYYYSYTRLPTAGHIRWRDREIEVSGNSWFDREWSSSALASDQSGWDWFALQLDDGRDLMFYRMRDKQDQAQRFSNGVLVEQSGKVHQLSLQNTRLEPLRVWRSPDAVDYPTKWRLQIPGQLIDLQVTAAFNDQEMRHSVHYWEGAVTVSGSHTGVGYLELSGYANSSAQER